jgi:hypothetical protein
MENLSNLDEDGDVREAISLFISGNGLSGKVKSVSELGLCHVRTTAQTRKIFAKEIGVKQGWSPPRCIMMAFIILK